MKRLAVVFLLAAMPAGAATFLVPEDRALVDASTAIVVATAGESRGRFAPGGWIETVTTLHVDETIKGSLALDAIDDVTRDSFAQPIPDELRRKSRRAPVSVFRGRSLAPCTTRRNP